MGINKLDLSTTGDGADVFVLATPGDSFTNTGKLTTSGDLASPIRVAANGVLVTNKGMLGTSGDGSPGITVGDFLGMHYDHVTVINRGTITTTGVALDNGVDFAVADGIDAFGDNNTVVNYGFIRANGFDSAGIEAIGENCLVVNYGTIESVAGGLLTYGLDHSAVGGIAINYGTIRLTGDPTGFPVGYGLVGGTLDGIAKNYGTIYLEGAYSHYVEGMRAGGPGGLAENYGRIFATADNAYPMFVAFGDNLLRNYGLVQVDGAYSVGISLDGADSRGENYGKVLVSDETSVGVYLGPFADHPSLTGGATFANYGLVSTVGIAVLGGLFDDVVINRGSLIGDVFLDNGADTYRAGAKGRLDGLLTLGDGDDLIVFENGGGSLTVTDFTPGAASDDVIDVSAFGYASFAQLMLHAAQSGSDVVLKFDHKDVIILQGVTLAQLHPDDFALASALSLPVARSLGHDELLGVA